MPFEKVASSQCGRTLITSLKDCNNEPSYTKEQNNKECYEQDLFVKIVFQRENGRKNHSFTITKTKKPCVCTQHHKY